MLYKAQIYWKDKPKEKVQVLISDDENDQYTELDEAIFFYVAGESEILEMQDPDHKGEFVVIGYTNADEKEELKKQEHEQYLEVLFKHISKKVKWGNDRFNLRVREDLKFPIEFEREEGKYTLHQSGHCIFEPNVPVEYLNVEVVIKKPRDYVGQIK